MGEAILVKGLQVAKREVTEDGQPEKMGAGTEVNGSVLLCPCLLCPFHMHIPQRGGYLDSSIIRTNLMHQPKFRAWPKVGTQCVAVEL